MSRRTKKQPLTPEELAQRQEFKKKRSRRRWKAFRGSLLRLLLLALVLYVLFFHLVGLMIMPTGDMFPRIDAGDLVLYYRLEQTPKAQDIVVLEKAVHDDLSAVRPDEEPEEGAETAKVPWLWQVLPDWGRKAAVWLGFRDPTARPARRFVGRVVAAGGDTVEVTEQGQLVVNGNSMIETNIFYVTPQYLGYIEYPLKLEADEVFVLADFRNGGTDSRFFGPVKRDEILGTVITVVRRNNL